MTTEALPGNTIVQHTRVETRKLQAEFLQGNMIDDAQTSLPAFPKGFIDECDGNNFVVSIVLCLPLSVWRC